MSLEPDIFKEWNTSRDCAELIEIFDKRPLAIIESIYTLSPGSVHCLMPAILRYLSVSAKELAEEDLLFPLQQFLDIEHNIHGHMYFSDLTKEEKFIVASALASIAPAVDEAFMTRLDEIAKDWELIS